MYFCIFFFKHQFSLRDHEGPINPVQKLSLLSFSCVMVQGTGIIVTSQLSSICPLKGVTHPIQYLLQVPTSNLLQKL